MAILLKGNIMKRITKKVLRETTTKYLKRRGFKVLDFDQEEKPMLIVAKDEYKDTLHFIAVDYIKKDFKLKYDDEFDKVEAKLDRSDMERRAIDYLKKHPEIVDVGLSLDCLLLYITGEDRALIRHHINIGVTEVRINDRIR